MEPVEKLIYVNVAARMLACTPRHIYNMVQTGDLAAIRIGPRGLRIKKASVVDFIKNNEINPDDYYA